MALYARASVTLHVPRRPCPWRGSPDTGDVAHAIVLAGPQTRLHEHTPAASGDATNTTGQVQRRGCTEHAR